MKRFYLLTLALFLAFITHAQLVSTYVGTGATANSASGLARLNTNLYSPWGTALDSKGNVWITTELGDEIKMLQTSSNNVYIRAGAYGAASFVNASGVTARFSSPRGIAVGPGDTLFVADYDNCAIRKITPFLAISNTQTTSVLAGKFTGTTTLTSYPGYANGTANVAQFNGPSDVAVDANGNVYVADANNYAIRKITRSGVVSTIAGGPTMFGDVDGTLAQAKFKLPTGLFLDTNGDLYVADMGSQKIKKISGNTVTTVVSGLYIPVDVIYTNGVYYITDQHRIYKYANSTLTTFAGSNTVNDTGNVNAYGTNARFNYVRSLFLNSNDGYIWVADQTNNHIKRVGICAITTPTITATGNDTLCQGDSVVLTGPAGYLKYAWSNGKSTQTITVKTGGSYTLAVTSNDSCVNTSNPFVVTLLNASSTITYTPPLTFCNGDSIVLKGPAGYTSYLWSNNSTTQNITVKSSDTFTLKVTKFFCSATSSPVIVQVKPIPTSTFTSKDSVCLNANIIVTYTGTAAPTGTYTWNFGGGTNVNGTTGVGPYTIKWTSIGTGTKQISLQVTENGCPSVLTQKSITVNPLPISTFTFTTPICALSNNLITYSGNGISSDSYNWKFDNGIVVSGSGMGPYQVYWAVADTPNVSLIVTDSKGCVSIKTTNIISVKKTPTSTFTAKKPTIQTYQIDTFNYTGDGLASDTFNWFFNYANTQIGSGKGPIRVAWDTAGNKLVSLTVKTVNSCSSTYSLNITVNQPGSKPIANFSGTPTTITQGQPVSFTDLSANIPTSWKWTFTGGTPSSSTLTNPTNIAYNTVGSFNVKLVVTNAYGSDSMTKTAYITVNASGQKPVANFSSTATTITQGGTVTFTDLSTNTPSSWNWTFTGGTPSFSNSANPTITYNSTGTFNVKLKVTNAYGSDSITKNAYITVNPVAQKPVANFSSTATTITQGGTVTFTDISTNTPASWKWTFQSGTPASSVTASQIVQYNSTGTFYVKLKVTNAYGSDSITKNAYVTVNPVGQKPVADFSADKTLIKAGQTVTFNDLSSNSPTGLAWSFQGGTPSTSALTAPVITYNTPGIYDVQLIAINAGGSDTMVKAAYIKVDPQGIEDGNTIASIKFYPSPVKDKLFIETTVDSKISSIEILDIAGRLRFASKYTVNGTLISLDLTILPKGLYILRISDQDMNYTGKFSKE